MKTIKELRRVTTDDKLKAHRNCFLLYESDLRESAIEDVKRFKKDIEYEEQQAELNKGISYVVRCVCLTRIFELKAKIEYIIEKFNFTEADLK